MQMDDCYPFGLTFNSCQRENSVDQKYLYTGKELQNELELGSYSAWVKVRKDINFLNVEPSQLRLQFPIFSQ